MADMIVQARKDPLLIDFARLVAVHYGKMVQHFAGMEGSPVSAHNNKTLFLEGLDMWCRARFIPRNAARSTEDSREIITQAMNPVYEALSLEDPSTYRGKGGGELPAYAGSPEDATATMLGLCATLDIAPIRIRLGLQDGVPVRAWGRVYADGKWYDSDINDPALALGEALEFPDYDELEVPLEMEEEAA
jgi:hypothetical protein